MKKTQLLNWMLFALLAFTFSACENEPLEGQFVTDDGDVSAENGQFIAKIDGVTFLAETTNNVYDPDSGILIISGAKQDGESIVIVINNAAVGTFDLTTLVGTSNSGSYFPAGVVLNPYLSIGVGGGSGELTITEFDTDNLTVSGTFSIIGVRPQLDNDGNPVLDGEGNIVYESVTISEGSFNAIPLTIDTSGGGDPESAFFALVNGTEFEDISFTAEQVVVGGEPMLNLIATNEAGATIRIDIPEGLGVGTFNFVDPISDGTKLIAVYNDGGGNTLTSESGSITITEFGTVTGQLAATFMFVGTDPLDPSNTTTVQVTEGDFNIDYIDSSGGVEDSFSAEIDAVEYVPTSITITQAPFMNTTIISITTVDEFSNQSLTVSFPIDIEVGPHAMTTQFVDGTETVGLYNPDIGNSILFASSPGILNIISYEMSSGIVEATFNFTAIDPAGNNSTEYDITNGQFIISIQ
jgi:Family of unknown function (DUF6252)